MDMWTCVRMMHETCRGSVYQMIHKAASCNSGNRVPSQQRFSVSAPAHLDFRAAHRYTPVPLDPPRPRSA